MPVLIIAEVGVNHNGSEKLALELIDAARDCGADAVKFQSFNANKLVLPGVEKAEYQKRETGSRDQHSMLRQLEMSESMHVVLAERCREIGIEFMSTPFDRESADFLVSLGMSRIKVSSAEITNHPFLEYLATFDLPMIVSTGMATLEEVAEAVEVIRAVQLKSGFAAKLDRMLSVLHCTSNYPAGISDVNLRAMLAMRDEFDLPVGYSDHTEGTLIATAAVAMGAAVIEKHFTLDRSMAGPDHKASLDPVGMADMISKIRLVESAMGSGEKMPVASELPIRSLVRRSIVVDEALPKGHIVKLEDLVFLRPGTGIPPKELSRVLGRRLNKAVPPAHLLQWDDME